MKKQLLALSLLATIVAPQAQAETERVAFDSVLIGNVFSKSKADAICVEEIEVSKALALKTFKESLEAENLDSEEISLRVEDMKAELSQRKFISTAIKTTPDTFFSWGIPRYTACQIYELVEIED